MARPKELFVDLKKGTSKLRELTVAQDNARIASENAWLSAKPMEDWKHSMARSDHELMTRFEEETMQAVGIENYSSELQEKYASKMSLRASRPS